MRSLLLRFCRVLTGCVVNVRDAGPTEYDKKDIERDKSERVQVELHMGVGELRVEGGAKKLMEGDFSYNLASWKPNIRYTTTGVHGYLSIDQPNTNQIGNNVHSKWDMKLADDVPLDMLVKFGVGEARLNLGSARPAECRGQHRRGRDPHGPAWRAEAQLRRPHPRRSGRSDRPPAVERGDLRRRARRDRRSGRARAAQRGRPWVNDNYDKAKVKINVDVRGGVGEIHLIAE